MEASEAACQLDPFAMQLGRAAEIARRCRGSTRDSGTAREARCEFACRHCVERQLEVGDRGLRIAVVAHEPMPRLIRALRISSVVPSSSVSARIALALLERRLLVREQLRTRQRMARIAPSSRVSGRPSMSSIARSWCARATSCASATPVDVAEQRSRPPPRPRRSPAASSRSAASLQLRPALVPHPQSVSPELEQEAWVAPGSSLRPELERASRRDAPPPRARSARRHGFRPRAAPAAPAPRSAQVSPPAARISSSAAR